MSDRRRKEEEEEESSGEESVGSNENGGDGEFAEATAEMGNEESEVAQSTDAMKMDNVNQAAGGAMSAEEATGEKKWEYTNLPKLGEAEPNFEEMGKELQRQWLRDHNVKGTWSKKLGERCHGAWDDMQAIRRQQAMDGELAEEDGGPPPSTEGGLVEIGEAQMPDFSGWTMDRKRTFLRRREVKGIWGKHVDEKCSEIWKAERAGEKYVHTPPSLGKRVRSRFPGQSVMAVATSASGPMGGVLGAESLPPLQMTPGDFQLLAATAQKNDLKGVSEVLNRWGQSQHTGEEMTATSSSTESIQVLTNQTLTSSSESPTTTQQIEYRWIHSEVTDKGVRPVRSKRTSSAQSPGGSKRRKSTEGASPSMHMDHLEEVGDMEITPLEQVAILQERLAASEAENALLREKLKETN